MRCENCKNYKVREWQGVGHGSCNKLQSFFVGLDINSSIPNDFGCVLFEGLQKSDDMIDGIISESEANGGCEACYRGSLIHGDDWVCGEHTIITD